MLALAIALCLILLNGVFALSELAIVSARKSRLQAMAAGRRGAAAALALAQDSGRFLSTVQIKLARHLEPAKIDAQGEGEAGAPPGKTFTIDDWQIDVFLKRPLQRGPDSLQQRG